jgi:hypothetical protein
VLRVGKNKRDPITEGPKVRKPKKRRGIGNSATESVFGKKRKEKGCSVFFFFLTCCMGCPPTMTTEKKSMEEVTGFLQSVAGNGSAGGGKCTV